VLGHRLLTHSHSLLRQVLGHRLLTHSHSALPSSAGAGARRRHGACAVAGAGRAPGGAAAAEQGGWVGGLLPFSCLRARRTLASRARAARRTPYWWCRLNATGAEDAWHTNSLHRRARTTARRRARAACASCWATSCVGCAWAASSRPQTRPRCCARAASWLGLGRAGGDGASAAGGGLQVTVQSLVLIISHPPSSTQQLTQDVGG
jgi:hypothetical protein